ncbi:uncharacterized protein BDZ99DRAFT_494591 [Mytilinidion resinicola]|uniref:F-box domain-containing protein n=1 Tax=Mytilinidion resinicola TaxID=574789 RepID=A0A6A6Z300_9PEZI|nr:uncharacterized protein BDZ99DRAFT_494591 [Mytilinidion resinicola]KAF2814654.1 hypothetical protein BDZ99DRAFT_494591 [Mytilinidion resinicola]
MASSLEQTPKEETTNLSRPPESPDTPTSISLISSLHTLTITPSAASRALNIPELLETILLLLSSTFHDLVFEHPTYTLNSEPLYHLLALCRVSKFWHNVIMNSTRFREPLFLHPIPKPADTVTDADDTDAAYQKGAGGVAADDAGMLVTQPPCWAAEVELKWSMLEGNWRLEPWTRTVKIKVKEEAGSLTLGELHWVLRKHMRPPRKAGNYGAHRAHTAVLSFF